MIKLTVPFGDRSSRREAVYWEMHKWMLEHYGREIPRRPNNTRQRRAWSMTANYWGNNTQPSGYIDIFVRNPAWVSHILLRWA